MILSSRTRIYRRYRKYMFYVAGGMSASFILYQTYYYLLLMGYQNRAVAEETFETTMKPESFHHHETRGNKIAGEKRFPGSDLVIGVDPELQYRYRRRRRKPGHFRCLTTAERIPWDRLNDDYCDCSDGSDEPSTSACSALISDLAFHCPMTNCSGGPKTISLHRVNDGICDCCDGSDELLHRDRSLNRFSGDLRRFATDRRTHMNRCFR